MEADTETCPVCGQEMKHVHGCTWECPEHGEMFQMGGWMRRQPDEHRGRLVLLAQVERADRVRAA